MEQGVQEKMNTDKQIKEMAKDLGIAFQLAGTTQFSAVAEVLVNAGYHKGQNDAIDELVKIVDDKAILAQKAVVYGCNTNRRLVCGHFAHNINDPNKMQTIEFAEAIQISSLIIEKLISMFGGENK